jgi:uncharacterized protein (TIGR02646 family)
VKFINFPAAAVDQNWLKRAARATARAAAKPSQKERATYIRASGAIWAALKETLEGLSARKCWYTEARDKVSHWQVDHYRPKSLYPWLAFSWDNLRLCGAKPNLRKLNEFPLAAGSVRGTEVAGIGTEAPILLDPTRWGDPDLLTFKANGEPVCATPADASAALRVSESIKLLDLDSETLCSHRRQKWRDCERKLKILRDILEQSRQQANADASVHMDDLCRDLKTLYDDDAEFTATAWACAQELNAQTLIRLALQRARQLAAA